MKCCLGERRPDDTFSGCSLYCDIERNEFKEDPTLRDQNDLRLCDKCKHPVSSHSKGTASATTSAQPESNVQQQADAFARFLNLLGTRFTVDEETEQILKFQLSTRLLTISSQQDAEALFQLATNYPHRTTAHRLEKDHALIVNGPFNVDIGTPAELVRAYSRLDGSPKILKFSDAEKEYSIYSKFGLDSDSARAVHLVHYEALISDEGGKKAVVMQPFNHALVQVPFYPEHVVFNGIQSIMLAMQHLHSKDIVHCDIKPANILVDTRGDWFLCDYGSCVELTETKANQKTRYTVSYIPTDFKPFQPSKKLDAVLLAVTALFTINPKVLNLLNRFLLKDVIDAIRNLTNEDLKTLLLDLVTTYA